MDAAVGTDVGEVTDVAALETDDCDATTVGIAEAVGVDTEVLAMEVKPAVATACVIGVRMRNCWPFGSLTMVGWPPASSALFPEDSMTLDPEPIGVPRAIFCCCSCCCSCWRTGVTGLTPAVGDVAAADG